jgi:predicted DCC family thiol-disulfide oxidoreductase YuxK
MRPPLTSDPSVSGAAPASTDSRTAPSSRRSTPGTVVARIETGVQNLYARTFLPSVRDLQLEQRKVAVLRVVIGLIAFVRTGLITEGSRYFYYAGPHTLPYQTGRGLLMLVAIAALTVGLLTPLAIALVFAFYLHFDEIMLTSTLGTQMFLMLLLFLFVVNAGTSLSLDSFLANRYRRAGAPSRFLLSILGSPGARTYEASYLLLFGSYALVNTGAVLYHWQDEMWAAGNAVGVMETSAYFSRFYGFFRWQEIHVHWLFHAMSQLAGFITEFWQFFMVPLIFTKTGKRFVVLWGFTFAVVSTIFFQLSYLPYLELCVLLLLFLPAQRLHTVDLYYDDACSLCRRSVAFLRLVNMPRALHFKPLSTNLEQARSLGVPEDALYARLHGVYKGRVYAGYDMCILITRVTPLVFLYPLAVLGKWLHIAPWLYERIAASRARSSHTCEVGSSKSGSPVRNLVPKQYHLRVSVIAVWALAVSLYSLELSRIVFPATAKPGYLVSSWAVEQFKRFGLGVPIVFDYGDLRASQRWAVIYRVGSNGRRTRIPFNGADGQRLSYYVDDQILYGASIPWHFITVGKTQQEYIALNQPGSEGEMLLQRVARYDYRRDGLSGSRTYIVNLFENHAAYLNESPKVRYSPHLVGSVSFAICVPSGVNTCGGSQSP